MNDGEALRREVVRCPDDDLPRLIYADWLDEYGQPDRAAFIRAQVEAYRAEPFSPAARDATARADAIFKRHRYDWTDHLVGRAEDIRFSRGFVEHVALDARRLPESAERVFELEPLRSLRIIRHHAPMRALSEPIVDWYASLEPSFEVPRLGQLIALDIRGSQPGHFEWQALLRSLYLDGIRDLDVGDNPLQPQWIAELFAGPYFPNLAALDLSDIAHIGPGFASAIARAPHRRLRRLNLSGIHFLADDLKQVLSSPCLSEIEELRLGWMLSQDTPGPMQLLEMAWVLPWNRLRVLDIAGQEVGTAGVEELTRRPQAANLRWLGLASNVLGPASVDALIAAKHLNLYYLDVSNNGLRRTDIGRLKDRFPDAVVVG